MLPNQGGTILVPIDGSERGETALKVAIQLAEMYDATIDLVTIFGPQETRYLEEFSDTEHTTIDRAGRIYAAGLAEVAGERLRHHELRWNDHPADEIVDYIESSGPDLVVISSHGRTGLSRWMLGSVAERVVRASIAPVLVLPDPEQRSTRRE